MTASPTPTRFSLRLPDNWVEFDAWRATRTGDLARLVDARITQQPSLARFRRDLLTALRDLARSAERQGALLCAAMIDPLGDDVALTAAAVVLTTPGHSDPDENTVEAIASRITAKAATEQDPTWRHVEILNLPVGRAVRVTGVESAPLGRSTIDTVIMQTLVPNPEQTSVLNVVLSSPHRQLAEPLLDLFDAITSTLAWRNNPQPAGAAGS